MSYLGLTVGCSGRCAGARRGAVAREAKHLHYAFGTSQQWNG
jgi:hypothetical protein